MTKISSLLIFVVHICCTKKEYFVHGLSRKIFSESQGSSELDISVWYPKLPPDLEDYPNMLSLFCDSTDVDREVRWTADATMNVTVIAESNSKNNRILHVAPNSEKDTGNFTCLTETSEGIILNRTIHIGKIVPGKVKTRKVVRDARVNESVTLSCDMEGYPLSDFTCLSTMGVMKKPELTYINETHVTISIEFKTVKRTDRSTYFFEARDYYDNKIDHQIYLEVHDVPLVEITLAIPVGVDAVYFEFTIDTGNDVEMDSIIRYLENGTEEWQIQTAKHEVQERGYVLYELEKNTAYKFEIVFVNSIGNSVPVYSEWLTTLEEDLRFVPSVWIEATTLDSIKIGWSVPPASLRFYLRAYQVTGHTKDSISAGVEDATFILENLRPETNYTLQVRACNYFSRECCDWSPGIEAVTLDRDPKFVPNVSIEATTLTSITIEWSSPSSAMQDYIHQYKAVAIHRTHEIGPVYLLRNVNSHIFENLESETSYLIKVAACSEYNTQCGDWSSDIEGFTSDNEEEAEMVVWLILTVAVALSIVAGTWIGIRKRRRKATRQKLMRTAFEHFNAGALDSLNPELNISDQAELLPYDKKWEFPRGLLKLDKILGSGAFGIVRKAQAQSIRRPEMVTTVAVKLVRATARLNYMTALDRELKILGYLGKHLNVVNLLGACTQNVDYGELLIIVEFCRFGNLRDYLIRRRDDFVSQVDTSATVTTPADSSAGTETSDNTKNCTDERVTVVASASEIDAIEPVLQSKYQGDYTEEDLVPIETRDLLCWIWQVSRGMKFLGSRRVIHGDLAARNILLADHNVVKICDFGMAKALQADEDYKKKGHDPLPVKWMAIESLRDRVFSYQSDIWSFGIVLWEFFTLGATPYPGIDPGSLYQKLKVGFRMERPEYATEEIYNMMRCCWDEEPARRPSFEQLEDILVDSLDESVTMHYIELGQPYVQMNDDVSKRGGKDYLTMTPSKERSNNTIDEIPN